MFLDGFEILTIGLPFCAFKIISGLYLGQYWLVSLGVIDLVINFVNFLSLLIFKKRWVDACFLSILTRLLKKPTVERKLAWQDFGNALDVVLSFILVAIMIGNGALKEIPKPHLDLWNIAVILNVLGAGFGRLHGSISNLKQ